MLVNNAVLVAVMLVNSAVLVTVMVNTAVIVTVLLVADGGVITKDVTSHTFKLRLLQHWFSLVRVYQQTHRHTHALRVMCVREDSMKFLSRNSSATIKNGPYAHNIKNYILHLS
jgi:urea transporter